MLLLYTAAAKYEPAIQLYSNLQRLKLQQLAITVTHTFPPPLTPHVYLHRYDTTSLPSLPSSHAPSPTPNPTPPPTPLPTRPPLPLIPANGSMKPRLINLILKHYPRYYPAMHPQQPYLSSYKASPEYQADLALVANVGVTAVSELTGVWGVGYKTAVKLVGWGVRSVAGLRRDGAVVAVLNRQQRVGVERYEELKEKMGRGEVEEIVGRVEEVVRRISGGRVSAICCGSYRRGKAQSGDCDVIMLPRKGEEDNAAVECFVTVLEKLCEEVRSGVEGETGGEGSEGGRGRARKASERVGKASERAGKASEQLFKNHSLAFKARSRTFKARSRAFKARLLTHVPRNCAGSPNTPPSYRGS